MTAYMSTQQILDRQIAEAAAIAKAQDPSSLTAEDLAILPGDVTADLMAAGKLTHLGLGARRTPQRRSR